MTRKDYIDPLTGDLRKGPDRRFGRKICGDGNLERFCYWVHPRFSHWVYNTWCGIRGEWWS